MRKYKYISKHDFDTAIKKVPFSQAKIKACELVLVTRLPLAESAGRYAMSIQNLSNSVNKVYQIHLQLQNGTFLDTTGLLTESEFERACTASNPALKPMSKAIAYRLLVKGEKASTFINEYAVTAQTASMIKKKLYRIHIQLKNGDDPLNSKYRILTEDEFLATLQFHKRYSALALKITRKVLVQQESLSSLIKKFNLPKSTAVNWVSRLYKTHLRLKGAKPIKPSLAQPQLAPVLAVVNQPAPLDSVEAGEAGIKNIFKKMFKF